MQHEKKESAARATRALLGTILALCLLHAFGSGFYMPSIWTGNYYGISFSDGFFRRALAGTLLTPFGSLRSNYFFIAAVQLIVGAALLALLLRRALTVPPSQKLWLWYVLCAAALSRYGAFFFATQGHPEYLMYLATLLSLGLKNAALRAALIAATMWVHEMALFTCLPLWFALEYLPYGRRRTAWAGLAASLTSFIAISTFFQMPDEAVLAQHTQRLMHASYIPAYDYLDVFRHDFTGERFNWRSWYGAPDVWQVEGQYIALLLALATILAAGLWQRQERSRAVLIFAAALTPLLMGWFGYDTNRWVFLALANTAVLFCVFLPRLGEGAKTIFMGALLIFLLTTSPALPDWKYYRTPGNAAQFLIHIGQHVSTIPMR